MTHQKFYSMTLSLVGLIIPLPVWADDKGGPPEPSKATLVFEHLIGQLEAAAWYGRYEQIRKDLEKDRKQPWEGSIIGPDTQSNDISLSVRVDRAAKSS
jgi:hypothetical protein